MARKAANPVTPTELKFPLQGLDEQRSFARQRPGTTASCQNVVGYEQMTGRARGGQRPGLVKYFPAQIGGGSPIQDLNHVVSTGVAPPAPGTYGGFVYAQASGSGFGVGAGSGALAGQSQFAGLGATPGFAFGCSCWDQAGNLYVAEVNTTTGKYILWIVGSTGTVYGPFPSSQGDCVTGNLRAVAGMCVIGTNLYVATIQTVGNGTALLGQWAITQTPALVLNTGSYFVYSASFLSMKFSTNSHNCLGSLGVTLAIDSVGDGTNQGLIILNTTLGPQQASAIYYAYGGAAQNNASRVCSDGVANFYVLRSTTVAQIMKIGAGGVVGATGWTSTASDTANGLAFDVSANMLVALCNTTPAVRQLSLATGLVTSSVSPGAQTWNEIDSDGQGNFTLWKNGVGSNDVVGLSNTLGTRWGTSTLANATHSGASVNKGASTPAAVTLGSRTIRGLVVANGSLQRFSAAGLTALAGGGGAGFSPSATVIFSAQNNLNVYYVDGISYRYYSSITDSAAAWTASTGTIPRDTSGACARLIETWRGRTVIAGLPGNPQQGYMSAVGVPEDWNFSPNTTTATQACAFTTALTGKPPDVINCLIPYADDTLIVGGAKSIRQLTGDPMAGGQWDTISEGLGMAWGRPWCRDLVGQIYFFGSKAGIFKMTPGALPVRISQQIEKRIENINMATNIIRMAWDIQAQGMWVFITPIGGGATTNFFYEERTPAWFPVVFSNANMNPVAVNAYDGDAATDRVLLLGGRDGYVRAVSPRSADDDGTAIESFVVIGPIGTRDFDSVLLMDMQATLDNLSGQVGYSVYVGTSAEDALTSNPVATGTWYAGRNHVSHIRRSGIAIYVKITAMSFWSMEYLRARYMAQGEVMSRIGSYTPTTIQQAAVALPAAPTGFAISAANGQLTLTWNSVAGLLYNIYRSTAAGTETLYVGPLAVTSYINTGLTNGTQYFYRISAVNAQGEGPLSLELSSTPNTGLAPAAPTSPSAYGTLAAIVLNWVAPDGAQSYIVYRNTVSGDVGAVAIATPTTATYTNTGLGNGLTYYYKISAVNGIGEGAKSTEVSATTTTAAVPSTVTLVSAVPSNGQVTLAWASVPGATSYKVYRGTTSGGEALVTSGIAATGTVDTGLANGTPYYYEIKATNANGDSASFSNELTATPVDLSLPAAPTNLAATGGLLQVALTWTQPAGTLLYYNLFVGTSPTNINTTNPVVTNIPVGTSYTFTGTANNILANGTTYYFQLSAANANGQGALTPANPPVFATTTTPAPAAPVLSASAGNAAVVLTWPAQAGVTSYSLYRELTNSGGVSGTLLPITIAGSATSCADTTPTNGTQYFYYLKAVNTGGTSAASNEVSATPIGIVTYVYDTFGGTPGQGLASGTYIPGTVPAVHPTPYWAVSGTVGAIFLSPSGTGVTPANTGEMFNISQVPTSGAYTIIMTMSLGNATQLGVIAFSWVNATNFLQFGLAGSNFGTPGFQLAKHVNNVGSVLQLVPHTLDTNIHQLSVVMNGSTMYGFVDGVQITTFTDPLVSQGPAKVGFWTIGGGSKIYNFKITQP